MKWLLPLIVILSVDPIDYVDFTSEPQIREAPDIESEYLDVYLSDYERDLKAVERELENIGWDFY